MKLPFSFALATLLSAAALAQTSPEQAGPLSPADSAATFKTFDDLQFEQVLAEPEVRQPVFLSFDERGRLWVMEYLQYPAPAGITLLSKDQFWRAVYDKVPPPPPNHFPGEDKISIHEDTDGDGTYDKRTTFVEGLNIATAFAHGRGGLWVLNPPYLLFYPDKNRDDAPDGPPQVHLSGFGLEDTHSVVNSLRWGPDGWLYAAQGSTVSGEVIRPGLDKDPVRTMGQLIWRYHPERKLYEIFAEGGGNAFGVEMDDKARIFSGHNGGDTRGFHYVQGGYLQKGFEKHGPLSNPYAFGYFKQMAHNQVERFTHNFIIYSGGSLPEKYHERLFGVEPLQGRVVMSEVLREGSSFKTKDIAHAVTTSDRYFKPVDIKVGPDGAIYVADWYDRQVAHTRNYEGLIDKSNGRIYRLKAKGAAPLKPFDLGQASPAQLLEYLQHPNRWFRQTALRVIADRKNSDLVPPLEKLIQDNTGQLALEATWALHLSGGLTDSRALQFLDHKDPHVRLWTARLLGDERHVSDNIARKLVQLAKAEPHVEVRSQLASTAKRLPAAQSLPMLQELFARAEDTTDIHIPLLLWWALESKADSDRPAVLNLFRSPAIWDLPIVKEHIAARLMRRYAAAGTRADLLTCAQLLNLAPAAHRQQLLNGLEQGTQGRSVSNWPTELQEAVANSGGDTLPLTLRRGEPDALKKAIQLLAEKSTPEPKKLQYTQILGETARAEAAPALLALLENGSSALKKAALHSLQAYDSPEIAAKVLTLLPQLNTELRLSALNLLASRPAFARKLLSQVADGQVTASDMPLEIIQKLRSFTAPEIAQSVEKIWPQVKTSDAALQTRIAQVKTTLQNGSGNPFEGQKYYQLACGVCHKLFGEGGQIGPDLTPFKRDDLDIMLVQIIDPNAEIREGYENILINTRDERTITGFLADKDDNVYVVRGLDGENTIIRKSDVLEFKSAGASLMPAGLLEAFDEQQIRDLFAYLRSAQPLVKPR